MSVPSFATEVTSQTFAGESFWDIGDDDLPPDYAQARFWLSVKLGLCILVWWILVPCCFISSAPKEEVPEKEKQSTNIRDKRKKQRNKQRDQSESTENSTSTVAQQVDAAPILPCVILGVVSCLGLLLYSSPYNSYLARAVFEAPLLTQEECDYLLQVAQEAAHTNYEMALESNDEQESGLLKDPVGWQKLRHGQYPTTDLNLVTDPFSKEHRQWIQDKLDARLAPLISRLYGIPVPAIRANDMFIVRYDANVRASLPMHTDNGDISFNILLNNEFEGGGTRFWNRWTNKPFVHVQPKQVGQVLINSALIDHEGMPIQSGNRYLLVGFTNVDRLEPFSQVPILGMSAYATYGSLAWCLTRLKEGYKAARRRIYHVDNEIESRWTDHKYIRSLFWDVAAFLQLLGDFTATHRAVHLVSDSQRDAYLQALDQAQDAQLQTGRPLSASWFKGQQINLDIDGSIASLWKSRRKYPSRFEEL